MDSDDELDALLDDALDTYDKVTKEEEERQEQRQKQKEEQQRQSAAAGPGGGNAPFGMLANDDAMAAFLEQTLKEMENGDEASDEDKHLQDLVKQGLLLVKGDDNCNDQEMMQNCLNLLNSVTQHMGEGSTDEEGDAVNPFMKELSEAVNKVAKGLADGTEGEGGEMSAEEREKLESVLKEIGQHTGGAEGAAARHTDPATKADPDALAAIAQMMMSLTADGDAAPSSAQEEDLLKAARAMLAHQEGGAGAAGAVTDDMAEEELKKLRSELSSLMSSMPPEAAGMLKDLEKFASQTEAELQAAKEANGAEGQVEQRVPEEE